MRPFYPHQAEAFQYCLATRNPALFMEMRLGKTVVAIRACKERGLKRVLVVAPKTTLTGWFDELAIEGVRRVGYLPPPNAKAKKTIKHIRWALVSFEYLARHPEIEKLGWDAIVVDESTRIKNPQAQISKFLKKHYRNCVRFILSGCPAPEDPMEYVNQFVFLNGEFMGAKDFWSFRKKYCNPPSFGWNWDLRPRAATAIKASIAQQAFVCTREAAGISKQQVYETRLIPQTPNQRRAISELLNEFEFKNHHTKWRVVTAIWAAQLAGGLWKGVHYNHAKSKELLSLLQEELAKEVVIVFFRFTQEIEYVEKILTKGGISHVKITGQTSKDERSRICRAYRYGSAIPKERVVLAQVKCAKYGLDFALSSTIVYYSNSFSLEERIQSEQRILHLKKDDCLLYIDLVTEDSMDVEIQEAIKEKRLDSKDFIQTALSNLKGKFKNGKTQSCI